MSVRAVRGATQLETDDREHMLDRVAEMVLDVMASNGLTVDDFISVIFTATSDLLSEFPAYAARQLGFGDVPLLCAFSDRDPITAWMEPLLRTTLPGAAGREHPTIVGAGHFVQEDAGRELAAAVTRFVAGLA